MSYIHPREINPDQPRMNLRGFKRFKYYVNLDKTEEKLRRILKTFKFTTIAGVVPTVRNWPEYELSDAGILPASESRRIPAHA